MKMRFASAGRHHPPLLEVIATVREESEAALTTARAVFGKGPQHEKLYLPWRFPPSDPDSRADWRGDEPERP